MKVPEKPPLNLPKLPEMTALGTVPTLARQLRHDSDAKLRNIRRKSMLEFERREERGEGDVWFEKQQSCPPEIERMKDFHVEVAFSYSSDDGNECMGWYHGVIQKVLNTKTCRVRIIWDECCLGDKDARVSDQILLPGNWNPKKIKTGGWREHLTERKLK